MEKPRQTSPIRLACWDLIGVLLVLAAFVLGLVNILLGKDRPSSGKWIWLGLFVVGMGISFIAEKHLRGEIWTDEELGPLRRLLDHPAWNVVMLTPFFVLLIMLSIRRLESHMAL